MCKCKKRKVYPDEFCAEFCIECGKIWILEFSTCSWASTERYNQVARFEPGVWIGSTFINSKLFTGNL